MSHHETKKEKEKKIRERNKRNWMIFQHSELHREQVDIGAPETKGKVSEKSAKKEEKIWSARLVEIRIDLSGRKKKSDDLWNRFAGTEGGGGRGR